MNQDEALVAALRRVAAEVPVGPPPVDAVVSLGRSMRRRRRARISAGLAAALVVPCVLAGLSQGVFDDSHTSAVPAPAAASGKVRVVAPGQRLAAGRGKTVWLTSRGLSQSASGASEAARVPDLPAAGVPVGKISAIAAGDASGTLWTGVYRGPGAPAKATVTVGGRTLAAELITLDGPRRDWVAFYVAGPRLADRKGPVATITVRSADGSVLATLAKRADTPQAGTYQSS